MSGNLHPFPVSRDDIAESFAASFTPDRRESFDVFPSPKRQTRESNPSTAPGSARNTPPPGKIPTTGSPGFLTPSVSPSRGSSRRQSLGTPEFDSRRSSMSRMATDAVKDFRKGVRNVTDTTKKATHKVVDSGRQWRDDVEATTKKMKDKTAGMGTHMMVATVGASKWVANHTSKKAKAAMDQARSKLSFGEKITLYMFEKISVLSRRGFTHVFMFIILISYTALGALLFMACEAPLEIEQKTAMMNQQANLTKSLWKINPRDYAAYESYEKDVKDLLAPYEDQLKLAFKQHFSIDQGERETRDWTFWKTMFFCSTIVTTIGYGHMTPKTTAGRALTIVYAIIGIPIFLILMADFGKLFTRLLKHLFIFIRRVYKSGTCVRARKHPTVQGISSRATGRLTTLKNRFLCGLFTKSDDPENVEGKESKEESRNSVEGEDSVVGPTGEIEDKYFSDGNFNLPVSLALFILICYMLIGCIIYINWENWDFFDAFYFIFISMTTIGFGDFVPEHPAFMMATALYLVFGLALTAMCINIIQEKLTNTFRDASTKLKESFSKIMESTVMTGDCIEGPIIEGPVLDGAGNDTSGYVPNPATSIRL